MPRATPRGLVAVSASAIAAVYLVGYLTSQSAAASVPVSPATSEPALVAATSSDSPPPPTLAVTPAPAASSAAYLDGVYSGTGRGRFGTIDVSVTIQAGRIADVAITRASTTFP